MEHVSETKTDDTLSATLTSVAESLRVDAEKAATGASEILDDFPGQQQALLLLVSALRLMGVVEGTREVLGWMTQQFPKLASIPFELGSLVGRLGPRDEAIALLSRVVEMEPRHPAAWRVLGNQLAENSDSKGAARAYARHMKQFVRELKLLEDAVDGGIDELSKAERMLRQSLSVNPTDAPAIQLLARVLIRLGRNPEAQVLLERALELAPSFKLAREDHVTALVEQMDWHGANAQIDIILKDTPGATLFETQKATNLVMLGEYDEGLALFDRLRIRAADNSVFWLHYGHAMRIVGRNAEAIEAYRKGVELDPGYGTAWWALANLKTYRFSPAEADTMRIQLERKDLGDGQRCQLEFALGQALENNKAYQDSFEHYLRANALRRPYISYDADETHKSMKRIKAFFTPEFFRARAGMGCQSPDPIFIVGMVRAGSTLVEQILSSHSKVEGTMELPDLVNIVTDLKKKRPDLDWPATLTPFDGEGLKTLGERYLQQTQSQRKLDRPFFTDKAGNNYVHVGLIQAILPNAKIIDVRRHPLGCCFSGFKQAFPAASVVHSYDLAEIGRYYRDYVELMDHYDRVLPGRVHRVFHEDLVRDPETEIRRLLQYCGLPFEDQCLRFYDTKRGVRTSSSEQVRKPIDKTSVESWQRYEPWLGPVKEALGEVLTLYPNVPKFD